MEALRAVEKQIEDYVKNSPQFKASVADLFDELDFTHSGRVRLSDARQAIDPFFEQIQESLKELEVHVGKPTAAEVEAFLKDADMNGDQWLNQAEFSDFFSKLLKFVAKKTAVAFAQTYGLGIVGGVLGVMLLKRGIKAVPIAGAVVAPFLVLLPSLVVGSFVGASAVYGMRKGDVMLVPKRLAPWVKGVLGNLNKKQQ